MTYREMICGAGVSTLREFICLEKSTGEPVDRLVPYDSLILDIEIREVSADMEKKILDIDVEAKHLDIEVSGGDLDVDKENKEKEIDVGC